MDRRSRLSCMWSGRCDKSAAAAMHTSHSIHLMRSSAQQKAHIIWLHLVQLSQGASKDLDSCGDQFQLDHADQSQKKPRTEGRYLFNSFQLFEESQACLEIFGHCSGVYSVNSAAWSEETLRERSAASARKRPCLLVTKN